MIHDNLEWLSIPIKALDEKSIEAATQRQHQLTKPSGSLGRLEELAIRFAGFQGQDIPQLKDIAVRVFAADHGICAQGVSAFPQAVTSQMIANFAAGGAAICVLSRQAGADLKVVNLGTVVPVSELPNVSSQVIAPSTADFSKQDAMTPHQLTQALNAGKQEIEHLTQETNLFVGGEMGIGNTSSASIIYSLLLQLPISEVVGAGTGLDEEGQRKKASVLEAALALHKQSVGQPIDVLRKVGGFEIAALVGSYTACAQKGIPVLVDGFISTAAALLAECIVPGAQNWFVFSHQSAEKAHKLALEKMNAQPLLDLRMRLGEGSGAALAIPILKSALLLHSEMATFESAGVSEN